MARAAPPSDPDLRGGLLSVVCLFFILLPCLMLSTSLYRLTALPFRLPGAAATAAVPERPSPIEGLQLRLEPDRLVLRAALRTTDVTAMEGQGVWNEAVLPHRDQHPDLAALQARLGQLHRLDPALRRIELLPWDGVSTDDLVRVMDAVRQGPDGALFPEITLGSAAGGGRL
jgi:hypothetical protein